MDVKTGNGAFAASRSMASELAQTLVSVANEAGLATSAWITDMNQVLGDSCGNAVEVQEAIDFLQGKRREPRLLELTRMLSAELLLLGGLALEQEQALHQVDTALDSGAALEHFARMVAQLGGPTDFVERSRHYLPAATVQLSVLAPNEGWIGAMATRDIGLLIIELGGGRRQASDAVDPRVGFTQFVQVGQRVHAGDLLAVVHAANQNVAENARQGLLRTIEFADEAPVVTPVLITRIHG